jgi:hypothetical protein
MKQHGKQKLREATECPMMASECKCRRIEIYNAGMATVHLGEEIMNSK